MLDLSLKWCRFLSFSGSFKGWSEGSSARKQSLIYCTAETTGASVLEETSIQKQNQRATEIYESDQKNVHQQTPVTSPRLCHFKLLT